MNVFRIVAIIVLLTGPAYAQTLIQSFDNKTQQQKTDDALKEQFAKQYQKKTPEDAPPKMTGDAWGNVRSGDAAKAPASKASTSRTANAKTASAKTTTVKPPSKTGAEAN